MQILVIFKEHLLNFSTQKKHFTFRLLSQVKFTFEVPGSHPMSLQTLSGILSTFASAVLFYPLTFRSSYLDYDVATYKLTKCCCFVFFV